MPRFPRISSFTLLALSLLLPTHATAEKPEGKGNNKGGKASENRSERAAERSNAQWQEDSKRGRDRADEVRSKGRGSDESGKADDKREKKH